jgi:hypothetical protein
MVWRIMTAARLYDQPQDSSAFGPQMGLSNFASRAGGDWRDDLLERHGELFGDHSEPGSGRPEVGDGWAELVCRTVERIADASRRTTAAVRIVQLKEKYGTLRLYTNLIREPKAQAAVDEVIALAEARSTCTCEECGDEGVLYERGDVLATLCARHGRGIPVKVRPGWENIHIRRALRNGKVRIVSCRRYIRSEDAFVDVPPFALGIKE